MKICLKKEKKLAKALYTPFLLFGLFGPAPRRLFSPSWARPSRPPPSSSPLSHPLTGWARLSPSSLPTARPLPLSVPKPQGTPAPTFAPHSFLSPAPRFLVEPNAPKHSLPHFPPLLASAPACCAHRPSPESRCDPPHEIRRSEPSLPRFALW